MSKITIKYIYDDDTQAGPLPGGTRRFLIADTTNLLPVNLFIGAQIGQSINEKRTVTPNKSNRVTQLRDTRKLIILHVPGVGNAS